MAQGFITKTIAIDGMTCVSCENRIERTLNNTRGIIRAKVSFATGRATVTFDSNQIRFSEIVKIIENLDYKVVHGKNEGKFSNNIQIIGVIVILLALYVIFSNSGGFNIFYNFPVAKEGMGYGLLFIIGLLTSVHCVAMCGGINLSQCVPNQLSSSRDGNKLTRLRPSILYNTGRVISYTVIGGIVGALGSVVSLSGSGKGLVAILAGIFMVIMGLNMLNIFPWLRRLNPRMPKIFATKINEKKNSKSPLYVGLLNGLMPCGPLQAMQLYALSTGDPVKGAVSMLIFSIGTVPLMFGLGALSSILSKRFTSKMMTVSAVLVVVLGVVMFSNGMTLSGYALPLPAQSFADSGSSNQAGAVAELIDGVQLVNTTLSSGRYEPIKVQAGIPVEWNIQAEKGTVNGCNNKIIIPEYGIEKELAPGDNIIKFIPKESGTISYSCWMGMIRSQISVYDDLSDQTQALPEADTSQLPNCCGGF